MEGRVFEGNVDSGQASDTLIKAVEGGDELAVGVVRDVKLEAEAHAMRIQGGLPKAFDRSDGIVGLVGRIFAAEGDGERGIALGP